MDKVLRNSKKHSILACGNTNESVSMKASSEFDNLFSLTVRRCTPMAMCSPTVLRGYGAISEE